MATNHYFRNFSGVATNEQRLMEDVIVESIATMGHDVYYIPREGFNETDFLFGENVQSKFERAYLIEMYLANVEGYEGDGDFFSKFGLEIRDTSNFIVSRKSFERYVPSSLAIRPKEGDLVYVPLMKKLFEIKFVEEELMFFSLGKRNPYIYELRCELFRYSNESIDTGVFEIDEIEDRHSYAIQLDFATGNGNFIKSETVYQGANLESAIAVGHVKEWDRANTKLQLINIQGQFTAGANVLGETSGALYVIQTQDDLEDFAVYDQYDNRNIQDEANTFIDFTDVNPFGRP